MDTCSHVHLTNVNNEWNPSTVKLQNGNKKCKHHCSQLHILCSALHNTIYYSNNINLQISKLTTNNEIDVKKKTRKSILSYSTKWFYRHRVNSDLQELERRIEAYVGSSKGVISSWNNDKNILGSTVSMLVLQYLGTCEK